jgi:hypothetical protein
VIGVAALLAIATACSSDAGSHEAGTEDTIGLRAPGPVDTGVIESYEQEAMPEDTPVEISPDGLTAELTACRQIGIEQWLWEGTITLPDGVEEATVELHLGSHWDDADPQHWTITAQVVGSGVFAIERAADLEPIRTTDDAVVDVGLGATSLPADLTDRFTRCSLATVAADVPLASDTRQVPIPATRDERPLEVDAAEGTVDALANGAQLGDHSDGRLPFAYLAAYEQLLPFAEVVVPDLDEVPLDEVVWWTAVDGEDCPLIRLTGSVVIEQTDACTGPAEDDDTYDQMGNYYTLAEPVDGLEGWSWVTDPEGIRFIRGPVGDWWLRVGQEDGPVESDEELIAIAQSLHTVRNDRVDEVVPRRDTGPDVDTVVDQILTFAEEHPDSMSPWEQLTERARLPHPDGELVVFEQRAGANRWNLELALAMTHVSGWRVHRLPTSFVADTGEPEQWPQPLCVGATVPYRDRPELTGPVPVVVVATREPTWTLEAADTPGAWEPLTTTEGIWIGLDDDGEPVEKPPFLRAIDEQGRPVEGAVAAEHACLP